MKVRLAAALLLLALASGGRALADDAPAPSAAELMDVLMWNREPVGGPFALVDHTGTPRTDQDFRGKVVLIYFGFTFCPDVCPTDLQQIGLALDRLGSLATEVQPLFITLDPKRDTPEHLAEYVPSFHKDIVGLSGSATAIRAAADAYKVYYREVAREGGSDYTIDHSAFLYLMDRDGQFIGFLPPGTSADTMFPKIQIGRIAGCLCPFFDSIAISEIPLQAHFNPLERIASAITICIFSASSPGSLFREY
jgi:cytochrome oxidase Cu insertion factor (SCO1/SenC/PrrC family)